MVSTERQIARKTPPVLLGVPLECERRSDPTDGRAKLIILTRKGKRALARALRTVEDIERSYAEALGPPRYAALVSTLHDLLDAQAIPRDGQQPTSSRRRSPRG
jgi:hypothetical protein